MMEYHNGTSKGIEINVIGVPAEMAQEMQELLNSMVEIIGKSIDLSGLDGITFAHDYRQALLELDRGYETGYKLTPSNDHGVGIAMSPSVIRDNQLKTHVVINAEMFFALLSAKRSDMAVNTIAHEFAHVELTHLYDKAFPGTLLQMRYGNSLDSFRTDCMLACWDEFGACWRSATFGPTVPLAYEQAFLPALERTRSEANSAIIEYRSHADIGIVINKVCGLYGRLLKYSAYHLGNLHGHGIDWRTIPTTANALQDHWFQPFFERLDDACKRIAENYGNWNSSAPFDALRDLAQDVVTDGGMHFERHENDRISLNIPFTVETMPVPPDQWC